MFGEHHIYACCFKLSPSNTGSAETLHLTFEASEVKQLEQVAAHKHGVGTGSLVLGQDQNCYGGCFNPQSSLNGDLADVRIWNKALTQVSMAGQRMSAHTADTLSACAAQATPQLCVCLGEHLRWPTVAIWGFRIYSEPNCNKLSQ